MVDYWAVVQSAFTLTSSFLFFLAECYFVTSPCTLALHAFQLWILSPMLFYVIISAHFLVAVLDSPTALHSLHIAIPCDTHS